MSSLLGRAVLAVTEQPAIRKLVTGTTWGRALAERFVAGDTLDDAVAVCRRLNAAGFAVSLDHLGEHVTDPDLARRARADYLACLERIAAEGLEAEISVKLTQLGLGIDEALVVAAVEELAEAAGRAGTTVTIDMEESRHTEATIDLFEKLQPAHGNLGIAVQAYLRRTVGDLDRVMPLGGLVRLCKGAYAEPPEVAWQRRGAIDARFDALTRLLMGSPDVTPAIATHDADRLALAERLASAREAPFEFQMLYGVRRELQGRLRRRGWPVRIYVPYGAAWYPYLTRRLAERPANVAFFLRALISR